jgi:hypothetical protein
MNYLSEDLSEPFLNEREQMQCGSVMLCDVGTMCDGCKVDV